MRTHTLRTDLFMLLTAVIWGSVFVAQRMGMDSIGPFLYTGLRFALGSVVLLPVILVLEKRAPHSKPEPFNRSLLSGGLAMGIALTLAMNLQQIGLLFTSVTHAGFITGLYVILVPLLGLFLGHHVGAGIWLGASLALAGMFMLSVGASFQVVSGDWLQLAGALIWAVHVLLVGHFASRHDPLQLALIQFAVCALASLLLAFALETIQLNAILAATPAIVYGGLLGVAVGFSLQVVTQQSAIASHAAIIFSLEAVFAALFGAWLLDETLSLKSYIGCALMLAGVLLAQLWPRRITPQP